MMTKSTTNALKCGTSALILGLGFPRHNKTTTTHTRTHTDTHTDTPLARLMLIEMHGLDCPFFSWNRQRLRAQMKC